MLSCKRVEKVLSTGATASREAGAHASVKVQCRSSAQHRGVTKTAWPGGCERCGVALPQCSQ
jgi:hypothetical protein